MTIIKTLFFMTLLNYFGLKVHSKGTMAACPSTTNISAFSYNLFSELARSPDVDNVLVSPFSVASAMALVLAGATSGSVCERELQDALGVGSHQDMAETCDKILASSSRSVSLTSANGLWSRSVKSSFVDTVRRVHGAEADVLPDTFSPIDDFIAKKTNGLLTNTMGADPVDPLTVAVLVNAVHFKGDWAVRFDEKRTAKGTFTTADEEKKEAFFMTDERKMSFAQGVRQLDGADVVRLDYGKTGDKEPADVAAFFILPADEGRSALNAVVDRLAVLNANDCVGDNEAKKKSRRKDESFSAVLEEMTPHFKLRLVLPRFKLSYGTKSVKEELRSLGVKSCFDDDEALLEMSDDPQVHLDDVMHKAVMEVTEEGTEAAAATVAIIKSRSIPRPSPTMRFDRPFVMVVLHTPTNTPLFVARVDDPELDF